jgi:hypothetical protein
MVGRNIVIAMRVEAVSGGAVPAAVRAGRWIILSRFGQDGRHLTVSLAGGEAGWHGGSDAPPGLLPRTTFFGQLMAGPSGRPRARFRLLPSLPEDVPVAGGFQPAQGHALLSGAGAALRLSISLLPEGGARSCTRLLAERRPWIGEVVDPEETEAGNG